MKYGAVIAVTGTSGKAARIRELGGGSFLGIEERIIQNFSSAGVSEIAVVAGPQKKLCIGQSFVSGRSKRQTFAETGRSRREKNASCAGLSAIFVA